MSPPVATHMYWVSGVFGFALALGVYFALTLLGHAFVTRVALAIIFFLLWTVSVTPAFT